MILRKPYALFIKYFKLLHVIMAFFIALLLYRSYVIYNFFKAYSIDYRSIAGNLFDNSYLGLYNYIYIFIVFILTIILLVVMIYKDKPKDIYLYNLVVYIFVIILYYFCNNVLLDARSMVLDIKLSKGIRDSSLIACFLQFISLILTIVRATGFDIKRFDFGTDIRKLDISARDSEEIEVSLEFDPYLIQKNMKNKFRKCRYIYVEHKFIINIVFLFFVSFISLFLYFRIGLYSERHSIMETFSVGNVSFNIQDSYLLDSDLNGNTITFSDDVFVVVRVQMKSFAKKQIFNKGTFNLYIDGLSYGIDDENAKKFSDFGIPYTMQYLSSDFNNYIFVFEVSKSQAKKDIVLKINDLNSFVNGKVGSKNIYINLKPVDLRINGQKYEKKIGKTIKFDDSILKDSSLKISNYQVSDSFKLNYSFCYRDNNCLDSYEYLFPTFTGNYFKALMRISGNFNLDNSLNIDNFYNLRDLLNRFGFVRYKINNEWKEQKINSEIVKPTSAQTTDYFIEVPNDVVSADEIHLVINIYNKKYEYVLK